MGTRLCPPKVAAKDPLDMSPETAWAPNRGGAGDALYAQWGGIGKPGFLEEAALQSPRNLHASSYQQ